MESSEIYQVLASYKEAIDSILDRLNEIDKMVEDYHKQYDDRFHNIEDTVNNEILAPAQEAFNKYDYDRRFNEFHGKYGEKLDGFNDKLKAIQGGDFDLSKSAFDEYSKLEEKPEMDSYVNELVSQVETQLEEIKKAMGVNPDAVIEVEKAGDAPATVEVESKSTQGKEEAVGHGNVDTKVSAKEEVNPKDDEIEVSDEVEEDDPTEVEKLMKEYAKLRK